MLKDAEMFHSVNCREFVMRKCIKNWQGSAHIKKNKQVDQYWSAAIFEFFDTLVIKPL